jgi:cytochrome P450
MRIVTHTVNRVLVGLPLARDDRWIQTTINYATNAFTISAALRPRSVLTRPFVYWFLDARLKLKASRKMANDLMVPVIQRVQRDEIGDDERYTILYWMIKNAKGPDNDARELVHKSLFLSLASIQSSVLQITHFMLDICAYPEYVKPLRQEIDEAIRDNGGWNVKALYAMQKLDSFLKESQRMNHPGLCACLSCYFLRPVF